MVLRELAEPRNAFHDLEIGSQVVLISLVLRLTDISKTVGSKGFERLELSCECTYLPLKRLKLLRRGIKTILDLLLRCTNGSMNTLGHSGRSGRAFHDSVETAADTGHMWTLLLEKYESFVLGLVVQLESLVHLFE